MEFVGQGAGPAAPRRQPGSSPSAFQDAVQSLHVAGAPGWQLVGHGSFCFGGKRSGALADLLLLALQVFVQHVAAEGRQVLW